MLWWSVKFGKDTVWFPFGHGTLIVQYLRLALWVVICRSCPKYIAFSYSRFRLFIAFCEMSCSLISNIVFCSPDNSAMSDCVVLEAINLSRASNLIQLIYQVCFFIRTLITAF